MKTLYRFFLILCLTGFYTATMAQPESISIHFADAESKEPLTGVTILQNNRTAIGISDAYGYVLINSTILREEPYAYIVYDGYKTDTLNTANPPETVYLQRLSVSLEETVISSEKVKRVLHSAREYVVDYVFVDNYILVASFSGANGRHAKLFLLDEHGDTITYTHLEKEPLSLFRSCIGTYYMASTDGLYPLDFTEDGLQLQRPYGKNVLPRLEQCKGAIGDNLYYKFIDPVQFSSNFERTCIGDSVFYPFGMIRDSLTAMQSMNDTKFMEYLLRTGRPGYAKYIEKMRDYFDRTARKMVDAATLYTVNDSIVIFDPQNYYIEVFDTMGFNLYQTGMEQTSQSQFASLRSRIINDPVTNKCYTYNFTEKHQYLQEINLADGQLGKRIEIERPFVENVKLHNGTIYYLWQNKNGGTRQLFKQMM